MYVQEHTVVLLRCLAQEIKILPNEFSSLFPGALPDTQIVFCVFSCFFSFPFAGRCASSAVVPISTASLCVCCCCYHLLLCGGGELVFAEGCTQVTGVMAMVMTGRVLLVCVLCVLCCGAGGVYARELDNKALGGCMASGALGMNTSYVRNGCNKYMPTPPLRSALPIPAIQAEVQQSTFVSKDGNNLGSVTPPGSGSVVGSGGKGARDPAGGDPAAAPAAAGSPTGGPAGPAGPNVVPTGVPGREADSLPSPGELPSRSDDTVITRSDSSTTHSGSGEEGVSRQEATGAVSPSSSKGPKQEVIPAVQQTQTSTSETIQTVCGEKVSDCGSEHSVGEKTLGKQELEESKAQKPPPAQNKESNDNEENPTEATSQESQTTEPQQEIKPPVDENDTTSTDASTAVAALSTSADSQEEATESSSNGSHSPLQGEVFTGTDTPENAASPAAAETETVTVAQKNDTATSDGSTAVSHATSPLLLLLLLVVACAAAAAAVAA
ncbi:Mucin-associated surface protein (MASP) [Trypanosoma cruzi]|uniref:Mucin-associated surface protein (MASP) n=1 Tax=Trypanosoma cruzi TaxID=5693 RepID=A0A2V2X551_TRYCR|nr:Mucin-associated surface protein (MASP) [Trypanosoma cruzi]